MPSNTSHLSKTSVDSKSTAHEAIEKVVHDYVDAARSGRGEDMKRAFHEAATIFGHVGSEMMEGPIQQLFDWTTANGPATGLQVRIASIDLVATVATVRLELDDWNGLRFTDLFTLLQVDGGWKITNKVFHLHGG